MGSVAIGPGDVHAGVRRDVDFYAGGFTAGMERNGHLRNLRSTGLWVESGAAAGGGEGFAVGAEFGLLEEIACGV